jgi:hypothetical protein
VLKLFLLFIYLFIHLHNIHLFVRSLIYLIHPAVCYYHELGLATTDRNSSHSKFRLAIDDENDTDTPQSQQSNTEGMIYVFISSVLFLFYV